MLAAWDMGSPLNTCWTWITNLRSLSVLGLASSLLAVLLCVRLYRRLAEPSRGVDLQKPIGTLTQRNVLWSSGLGSTPFNLFYKIPGFLASGVSAAMRYPTHPRRFPKKKDDSGDAAEPPKWTKQTVEAFLVLDIEGTCNRDTGFDYPNEIIEFPVCLMRWKDKGEDGLASELEVVDEFRTFVRPTWRPTLSEFCTELTGITQAQVDSAPLFPEMLAQLHQFLMKNELLDEHGQSLVRFCWCSDGPFDVRDFVVKQCFISKVRVPSWLQGDILDVRTLVLKHLTLLHPPDKSKTKKQNSKRPWASATRRTMNIATQLKALDLSEFAGREHSGIDDARNITRVLAALARKGTPLQPNTPIQPHRRWPWMGPRRGEILEETLII